MTLLTLSDRARLALGVARRVLGLRVLPYVVGLGLTAVRVGVTGMRRLDGWFYPALQSVEIRRPIVIVGNPRTGTTFLQRFLCDQGYGVGMPVYRMLYASLILQRLLRPFLPLLEAVSPAKYHTTAAHSTSLTSVETDDVSLMFRYFDGFFLYGFIVAFHEEELRPHFLPENRNTNERDFAWLESQWRRNLVANDSDRNVAKLFSLGARLPAFQAAFPSARVLYTARDPLQVIPSGMSLVTGVLDNAFGFWSMPEPLRARWCTRMYAALVDLLRHFHSDWEGGRIAKGDVYIVRYDRMMSSFETVMDEVHTFIGHAPTEAQVEAIRAQAEVQRSYRSDHVYDLARFGLTEQQIRTDCAFFYETFLQEPA